MVRIALLACLVTTLNAAVAPLTPRLMEKVRKTTWREGCPLAPEDLRQVTVAYLNFNSRPATGILIVHKDVAKDIDEIFRDLYKQRFQIAHITPIEEYGGDDDASIADNNTSAFNCRSVTGKPGTFSNHSWGLAIDINPLTNPYVKGDNVSPPEGRKYLDRTMSSPGLIVTGSYILTRFEKSGWKWGGDWTDLKDYQHFEKAPRR